MQRRAELAEFLRSRRARHTPQELGLTPLGGRRRVPGLRREELAHAAGVSVEYYVRLEQGRLRNPSEAVIDAIASALGLDRAERTHLHNLARPRKQADPRRRSPPRPALSWMLDAIGDAPALIVNGRTDVLAWNRLCAALVADFAALPARQRNMVRLLCLDPGVRGRFVEPETKFRDLVAHLRMDAGRHPEDPDLVALVGELSVKSAEFARLWSAHGVREKSHGRQRFRHPVVGELTLELETFQISDDPDLWLVCYVAEPDSPAMEALRLLASWTAQPAS